MLILGVMGVINLAHGSSFTLGAYMALTLVTPEGGLKVAFLESCFGLPASSSEIAPSTVSSRLNGPAAAMMMNSVMPVEFRNPNDILHFGKSIV